MVNLQKLAALVATLEQSGDPQALTHHNLQTRANPGWTGSAGTTLSKPSNDSFYNFLAADEISNYTLGDIIKSRPVGGFSDNANLSAYQLVYRSENSFGVAVGALTTVLVPNNNDGKHVVVFPQPEDSSYINCASSYSLLESGLGAQINLFLSAGYVVNIPDHEGFNSSFVAGVLEGKLTLDSIRALEASRDLTGVQNDEYVIVGYSGGSIATGWAAELQASYAPDLNILGFSMGGYVASPEQVWLKVNETPFVGFLPAAVMGLASEYTALWDQLGTLVRTNSSAALLKALSQCVEDDIVQYYNQDFFSYFNDGKGILQVSEVQQIIANNTLGKQVPSAQLFIYNGVKDQIVPVESVDSVVEFYCEGGASVVYNRGANEDHVGMAYATAVELYNWVGKVFAGNLTSGCKFEGVTPAFANASSSTGSNSTGSNSTGSSSTGSNGTGSGSSSVSSGTSSGSSNGTSSGSAVPTNKGDKRWPNIVAILIGLGFVIL